jgi:hypothetical protein
MTEPTQSSSFNTVNYVSVFDQFIHLFVSFYSPYLIFFRGPEYSSYDFSKTSSSNHCALKNYMTLVVLHYMFQRPHARKLGHRKRFNENLSI